MNTPENLKYAKSDEWFDADSGKVGITDYAQSQLSDIVFVEILVDEGDTVEAGKPIASVESVKASAEIYSPASGKVSAINKDLPNKPEAIKDRKSTRLNSSHGYISYAVFCLKKKIKQSETT